MMNWQTIDFQGIVGLESPLISQLQHYLEEKESQLAQFIANTIPAVAEIGGTPSLPTPLSRAKLSEGVEAFTRRAHQELAPSQSLSSDWKQVAKSINNALWEYVEILESCSVELFQRVDQVGFEQWKPPLVQVIESIKDILLHSMEDLKWAIKRLESQLQEYRRRFEKEKSGYFFGHLFSRRSILDRSMLQNLEKSQKFLNFKFQNFNRRYGELQDLDNKIDAIMAKFSSYTLLDSIDPDEKYQFKQLYRMLKIWEKNSSLKVLSELEIIRGIHRTILPEKANQIFKEYYLGIKNQLFDFSRKLKQAGKSFGPSDREELQRFLAQGRLELHTLGSTIDKYREFLLKSDPDPYVRTRGGFTEWIIGLEPAQSKSLLDQEYDIEALDTIFQNFEASIPNMEKMKNESESLLQKIWETLHDMAQPLASRKMMETRGASLLDNLKQIDELSSTDPAIVDEVTKIFSRALRADWRYNVLNDLPEFHTLYFIHQGILGPDTDRNHLARLGEFKLLTNRLYNWIREKKLLQHRHDVDLDMNDIKESLQDMFAYVQRIAKDPNLFTRENGPVLIQGLSRQLMEYRYLFNQFFHQLRGIESDEKLLRNQFLFVDHYFESIENKLIEMQSALS